MLETAEKIFDGDLIVLHGGEPLLLPVEDIEKFLKFAYRKCGKSSVVTNGYAIDDEKIRLFKKYRTEVCVSIDGFPEMNLPRAPPEITEKILKNIETLTNEGICVNIMFTPHRYNCDAQKIVDFFNYLKRINVSAIHVNKCKGIAEIELNNREIIQVNKLLVKLYILGFDIDMVRYMIANLSGAEEPNDCYLSPCDIFHTVRGRVILGDGSLTCCLNTNNTVMHFSWSENPSYERYAVLKELAKPIGCKGCKYWEVCYAGCPANGEWRRKDPHCPAIYATYKFIEEMLSMISKKIGEEYRVCYGERKYDFDQYRHVHRVIKKHVVAKTNTVMKTVINGITQIEYPDMIEVVV